ncbi:MAG TPA: Gfo/Idh/MocA family oxidoreductase [Povalibacter sp.]|nr:Gfo/Idh/MocA family oxidoreductase [Povalibacter sp.]
MKRSSSRALFSRRQFTLGLAATGAAASLPLIIPARLLGAEAPSNRLRVGQIGCGRIAQGHDLPGVLDSGVADVVAVCDVDSKRAADARKQVETYWRERNRAAPPISIYGPYQELLRHPDLDAVVISTPDHWHAEVALAAILAGKDVYLQKPFTMTLEEGKLLRDAVASSGRILQVGSQQRSTTQFRQACELIRSGRIGSVRRVEIGLPIDPTRPDDPKQPVPATLDFDRWLGSTPEAYYTEQRVHPQADYSRPGWLRNESYCLGMITGWGSHHYDTMHWALDTELSGPSRIEGRADFPTNKIWNVHGAYDVQLTYRVPRMGDVLVSVSDKHPNGLKFFGEDGWIWVTRSGQTTSSDPAVPGKDVPPLAASDPRLLAEEGLSVHLPRSDEHHKNWLECVRSRQQPIAPAAVAHRSGSACIVSWIAMKLGRPLTWDPVTERFVKDDAANAMLALPERAPYGAVRLSRKHA